MAGGSATPRTRVLGGAIGGVAAAVAAVLALLVAAEGSQPAASSKNCTATGLSLAMKTSMLFSCCRGRRCVGWTSRYPLRYVRCCLQSLCMYVVGGALGFDTHTRTRQEANMSMTASNDDAQTNAVVAQDVDMTPAAGAEAPRAANMRAVTAAKCVADMRACGGYVDDKGRVLPDHNGDILDFGDPELKECPTFAKSMWHAAHNRHDWYPTRTDGEVHIRIMCWESPAHLFVEMAEAMGKDPDVFGNVASMVFICRQAIDPGGMLCLADMIDAHRRMRHIAVVCGEFESCGAPDVDKHSFECLQASARASLCHVDLRFLVNTDGELAEPDPYSCDLAEDREDHRQYGYMRRLLTTFTEQDAHANHHMAGRLYEMLRVCYERLVWHSAVERDARYRTMEDVIFWIANADATQFRLGEYARMILAALGTGRFEALCENGDSSGVTQKV